MVRSRSSRRITSSVRAATVSGPTCRRTTTRSFQARTTARRRSRKRCADLRDEIEGSELFRSPQIRRYEWDITYTADEYLAVLDTYSGHRSMTDGERGELYRRIRRRVEARPEGLVTKSYLAILNVARTL